jgi:hypothetical protein
MDYFYFNGENWIEVTEEFGRNDDSWFNEYKDIIDISMDFDNLDNKKHK